MTQKEIMHIQERIGADVDGFWGPLSTDAAKQHLINLMPPNRFPTQREVRGNETLFGSHGNPDNSHQPPMQNFRLPFQLHLYGNENEKIGRLSCHAECAAAMEAVFHRLAEVYPDESARKAVGILDFFGIYNPRFIVNGRVWSMHAYAVAIDFDANRNRNRSHWPTMSKMPIEVMECFAQEGFLAAGAFWSRDAMHFQATSM